MASSRLMLIHASLADLVQVHARQEQFQKSNFHKKEPYGSFLLLFKKGNEDLLVQFQEEVDRRWEDLQFRCSQN